MRYFTIKEMTASSEARRMGIDNTPTPEVVENLTRLVERVLDPLRSRYGHPVIVNSGYRCPRLNKAVGGTETSQHVSGDAADIYVPDAKGRAELFSIIMSILPFDQLIWERGTDEAPAWIHVSYRKNYNRIEILRYDGKRYRQYTPKRR